MIGQEGDKRRGGVQLRVIGNQNETRNHYEIFTQGYGTKKSFDSSVVPF